MLNYFKTCFNSIDEIKNERALGLGSFVILISFSKQCKVQMCANEGRVKYFKFQKKGEGD